MGITINFWEFQKARNSTKRPDTGLAGAIFDTCETVEPFSVLNPNFAISVHTFESPVNYNYCYVAKFDRYYFVNDWTFDSGLWYVSLTVDPLATWRGSIGNQTLYVLRSSSRSNGAVTDSYYPATSTQTVKSSTAENPWKTGNSNGSYVMGTVGDGPAKFYSILGPGIDFFLGKVFSDEYADLLMGPEWSSKYPELKTQVNPSQYITGIKYMPFNLTGTQVSTIPVGWVGVFLDGIAAFEVPVNTTYTFNIAFGTGSLRHPQAAARGAYLNSEPYSSYSLFFPPFGTLAIPSEIVANSTTITANVTVDCITGQGILRVMTGSHVVTQALAQVAADVVVGDIRANAAGLLTGASTVGSVVGSVISGNFGGAAGKAVGSIQDYAAMRVPTTTVTGSAGGVAALKGTPALTGRFLTIVDDDPDHNGRPLCQDLQLSTIPGFIQVEKGDVEISGALAPEMTEIKNYLEGGFYFE